MVGVGLTNVLHFHVQCVHVHVIVGIEHVPLRYTFLNKTKKSTVGVQKEKILVYIQLLTILLHVLYVNSYMYVFVHTCTKDPAICTHTQSHCECSKHQIHVQYMVYMYTVSSSKS